MGLMPDGTRVIHAISVVLFFKPRIYIVVFIQGLVNLNVYSIVICYI
jgi:hypothetical protein